MDNSSMIRVPRAVYNGIEAVRRTGKVNMFDYPGVMKIARRLNYDEAYLWLLNNRKLYAQAIFCGMRPDDEPDNSLVRSTVG